MFVLAAEQSAFSVVVLAVAALGLLIGLVIAARSHDGFTRGGGRFWIFHGEADTSPHEMPGTRFEERHVIDPQPNGGGDHV